MKYTSIKQLLILSFLLFIIGCKEDPKRHLKLGQWYAQKDLIEEAILEFKEVTRLFPLEVQTLSREDFATLSKAHYNLSLMYTKKGWWEYALNEARTSFEVQPNKDSHDLVQLIEQKLALRIDS